MKVSCQIYPATYGKGLKQQQEAHHTGLNQRRDNWFAHKKFHTARQWPWWLISMIIQ